jgi:hypothetical protein
MAESPAGEAKLLEAEFSRLLDPSIDDKKVDFNAEIELLVGHLEDMKRVGNALLSQRSATAESMTELDARMSEELRRVFEEIDRIAAHVKAVDAAVAVMESAVTEYARTKALVSIKNTFSPISRLFGVETSNVIPPFVRPPQSRFDLL